MSDEPEKKLVPVPCVQCGRPPVAAVGVAPGQYVNVCLEHFNEFETLRMQKVEMYGRMAQQAKEQLEDQMADAIGMPRKQRPQQIPAPRVNVHQVNIHGNNLGVVNTGTVSNIRNHVSIINSHDAALAAQLGQLTDAILASNELNDVQKQEAADLLSEVTEDVSRPAPDRRSRAVMRTIAVGLGQVLSHAADLYTLWTAIEPHVK